MSAERAGGVGARRWALAACLALAACPSSPEVVEPVAPPRIEGIGALFRVARLPDGRDLAVFDRLVVEGPAARAGVVEGEALWSIDGADAAGMELMEVVRRLKGPEGAVVALGLGPVEGGPARTVEVARGPADLTRLECLEGDCATGRGVRVDAFGDLYEGDFAGGRPHGTGKLTTRHGRVYSGDFADGVPHGMGIQTTKDGTVVTGRFAYGLASGPGKITRADGHTYEGWIEGQRMQGEGKLTHPASGDTWTGTFMDDRFHTGLWVHHPGTDGRRCTRKVEAAVVSTVGVVEYASADPKKRVRFEGAITPDCVASEKGRMTYQKPRRPVAGHFQADEPER